MSEQDYDMPPKPAFNELLPILEAEGIDEVVVSFYGGGDSGQIEDIWYYSKEENVTDKYREHVESAIVDGKWQVLKRQEPERTMPTVKGSYRKRDKTLHVRDFTVTEIVEELAYERIMDAEVDWYNDEGGQGTYALRQEEGDWQYSLTIEVNHTVAEIEHESGGEVER